MTAKNPDSQATKTTASSEASRRSKWPKAVGVIFIAIGLFMADPFIRPYVSLVLTPPPKTKKQAEITKDRIFIPSIKLDAPLFADISKLNYGIAFLYENNLGKKQTRLLRGTMSRPMCPPPGRFFRSFTWLKKVIKSGCIIRAKNMSTPPLSTAKRLIVIS